MVDDHVTQGLAEPALQQAIVSALGAETARDLLDHAARNPTLARRLVETFGVARAAAVTPARPEPVTISTRDHANLIARAMKAQATFAMSGFAKVDARTLDHRLKICSECPHMISGAQTLLHRLGQKLFSPDDNRICNACGCFITAKAERATESCPETDPDHHHLTRWGEPVQGV